MPLRKKVLQTDVELFLYGLDGFLVHQKMLVEEKPWRRSREIQSVIAEFAGPSFWDWILCAFGAAADALQAAGPRKSLRDFVDAIIQGTFEKRALPLEQARKQLWGV